MNLFDPVSTIMTKGVFTVTKDTKIREIAKIFEENKFHHLPVTEGGKLVGIVSKSDFLLFKRGYNDNSFEDAQDTMRARVYTAADIMTEGVAYLESTDRINVALELFNENLFHAIPIVEDKLVVGILTTFDIIKKVSEDKQIVEAYS